jgi:hypothetical protein
LLHHDAGEDLIEFVLQLRHRLRGTVYHSEAVELGSHCAYLPLPNPSWSHDEDVASVELQGSHNPVHNLHGLIGVVR